MPKLIRRLWPVLAAIALCAAVVGCGGTSGGGSGGKVTLAAYSTPKEAYEGIIPAFNRTAKGKGVGFDQSYGSSGEQQRAVEGGLPADVVAFSLEPDITKLVDAGIVAKDWNENPYKGFVTNSVATLAVREGNPKKIKSWDDLIKPGVDVISPNPFTSGGAKWNIMAAYGAQLEAGKSPDEALDYLGKLFKNVSVLDKSAREAGQTFAGGKGDVLIAYENEAITAQQKGEKLEYVTPPATILIENPVAVTERAKDPAKAKAFVDFLTTPTAQRIYASKGYRPVIKSLLDEQRYPQPAQQFTIAKFGGWGKVNDEFFEPESGKVAKILDDQGKSTGGG